MVGRWRAPANRVNETARRISEEPNHPRRWGSKNSMHTLINTYRLALARPRAALAFFARLVVLAAFTCGVPADLAADRVRPTWGGEALWGYWKFGGDYVPNNEWKVSAVSQDGAALWKATNLFDEDANTFYYPNGQDAYEVEIDLGRSWELGAFTVLTMPPPNKANDSRMARYEFFVSDEKGARGAARARGDFDAAEGTETVVKFRATRGRYVTLKAFARANATKEVCVPELRLVSAEAVARHDAAQATAAVEKKTAWETRDAAAAVEAQGKDLAELIFCTQEDINRSNLRSRPKLEEIGKLKKAGTLAAVPRAFRDYYFDKLRRPQSFGLPANDVHPYGRGYAGFSDFPQSAMDKDLNPERLAKADRKSVV